MRNERFPGERNGVQDLTPDDILRVVSEVRRLPLSTLMGERYKGRAGVARRLLRAIANWRQEHPDQQIIPRAVVLGGNSAVLNEKERTGGDPKITWLNKALTHAKEKTFLKAERNQGYRWMWLQEVDSSVPNVDASANSTSGIASDFFVLNERLIAKGALPSDKFRNGILETLGNPIAIGNAVLQSDIAGFQGVQPGRLAVKMRPQASLKLPECVEAQKLKSPLPADAENRPKVSLIEWGAPIVQQGGKLRLSLALSDYHTAWAMAEMAATLHQEIQDGTLHVSDLHMCLGVAVVVITGDNQLILSRRGTQVHQTQCQWESSVSEWIEPTRDQHDNTVRPELAVHHALISPDELNLPPEVMGGQSPKFVALVEDWGFFDAALVAVVRLPLVSGAYVSSRRPRRGEHDACDMIPFSLQTCVPLVVGGRHAAPGRPNTDAPLCDLHRVSLLAALISEFDYDNVARSI